MSRRLYNHRCKNVFPAQWEKAMTDKSASFDRGKIVDRVTVVVILGYVVDDSFYQF